MIHIVCPNCHSSTPPFRHCIACNSVIGDLLNVDQLNISKAAPSPGAWFFSNLAAVLPSALRRLFFGAGRKVRVQMDAHLRRECRRIDNRDILRLAPPQGKHGLPPNKENEMTAVARVADLDRFKELAQVNSVTVIAEPSEDYKHTLVTARIRGGENEIENLCNEGCVMSLHAAGQVRPHLDRTIRETLGCEDFARDAGETEGGKGVIVGVVDFGLDFAHKNFRLPDGSTRILALWDQRAKVGEERCSGPFGYGRLFTKDDIDAALKEEDPYKALGYWTQKNSLTYTGAHGAYVTDVAAGNGNGSGCPGVAPEAGIVFVDASSAVLAAEGSHAVGNTFGDSAQLLEAVKFIFDYAEDRPCVVNISLGTNGGPHDGTSPLEEGFDRLVSRKPNRAVVIAAGNSFGKSLHATGRVAGGEFVDLKWRIPRFDPTGNEIEVWYSGDDRFTAELSDPAGRRVARVKPGCVWDNGVCGSGALLVVNRLRDLKNGENGENTINVILDRGAAAGDWTLRLRGDCVEDGRFDAWIERDERGQSKFIKPTDKSYGAGYYAISNECTLSSIACGRRSIVVSSYDAYEPDLPLSETSSAGPARGEREFQQPTVCAPGENILAAQSGTLVLRHRQSGTSLAAAAVTGAVALILSEARRDLTAEEIRGILIEAAHKAGSSGGEWDPGYGYGRVCASEAIATVRALTVDTAQASVASSSGD